MAERRIQHNVETVTIATEDALTRATFLPSRGGFGSSLMMPVQGTPQEMLFTHDFFWDAEWPSFPGGFPFLFPVCARLGRDGQKGRYLYDGQQYHLDIHGFGWHEPWSLIDETEESITLQLLSNARTLAVYPFKFEVRLRYTVSHCLLSCHQTVVNHGDVPMPFYAGFHPYLRTPMPGAGKEQVMLDYQPYRRLQYNAEMTDIVEEQPLFTLPTAVTDPEISEQLTMVAPPDKTVQLHYPEGYTLHLQAEGVDDPALYAYVQLYTMADKPFFCAEPWMGFPNAMNTVQGVQWLQAGEVQEAFFKLWLSEKTIQ